MSAYWKEYWDRTLAAAGDDPFLQVGRRLRGEPMSESMFRRIVDDVLDKLELDPGHRVLDLCCGNGLLGAEIARRCRSVVGVDFSETLVAKLRQRGAANLAGVVGDALTVELRPGSFDRALFAGAAQHFSQPQLVRLFMKLAAWLKPGGILLLTDVLDADRIWEFYRTREQQDAYFQNLAAETPILGTWLDRSWLERLARHAGFRHARAHAQPDDFWCAHYRFDLRCRK